VNVALVFTPDYSERLHKLAFHTPVWVVETPENRAAAEESWLQAVEWPHISVTVFRADHEWRALLAQIELRHQADTIDIIGTELTDDMRTVLEEAGFTRIDPMAEGFRARKVIPSS